MLAAAKVDFGHQDFRIALGFGEEFALWAKHMAGTPEIDACSIERRLLMADAVARQDRQAVGNGMAAVAEDPGIALAVLLGLVVSGIPADRGRIEQQFGAG